jgi:uncharacterized membrane protein YqjE
MLRSLLGKFSLAGLATALLGQVTTVIRYEIEEAKREFRRKVKAILAGIGLLLVGAAFALCVIGLLILAAVDGLANVWPVWLSALTVAGGLLVFAIIFFAIGAGKIRKNTDLRPERVVSAYRAVTDAFK